MAARHSTEYVYYQLFLHSHTVGHSWIFHFITIVNNMINKSYFIGAFGAAFSSYIFIELELPGQSTLSF